MIHADSLQQALRTPKAAAALHEGLLRLTREPWIASSLEATARHRLRMRLGLPAELQVAVFPSAQEARLAVINLFKKQGSQVELLPGLSPRWAEAVEFCGGSCCSSADRRGFSIGSLIHHDTGAVQPLPEATDSSKPLILDATLHTLFLGASWETVPCGGVFLSLEPLLGRGAPALWIAPAEFALPSFCAASATAAAMALEEWEGSRESDGFEASRYRARVEELLREECRGVVLSEASERLPGGSAIFLPGRSAPWIRCLLHAKGVWCRLPEALPQLRLGTQTLVLQGGAESWKGIAEHLKEWVDILRRAPRLTEGLTSWPLLPMPLDPHAERPKVQSRATRPLYTGVLRPDHAIEGLRWVAVDGHEIGIETRLALLVDEEDGIIVDAAYQAFGPPTLIALGEILCELLIRQHWLLAERMPAADLEQPLLGEEPLQGEARAWSKHWLQLLGQLCARCHDLPGLSTPLSTPIEVGHLEPGKPLEGWEEMPMERKIQILNQVLDQDVRPYIALDAGGIVIQEFNEPILKVRYSGTCVSCPSSIGSTLQAIQQTLRAKVHPDLVVVPDFSSVDPSGTPPTHAPV
ncbi:MAG: NifU family protein [Chlamydiia bacterium]